MALLKFLSKLFKPSALSVLLRTARDAGLPASKTSSSVYFVSLTGSDEILVSAMDIVFDCLPGVEPFTRIAFVAENLTSLVATAEHLQYFERRNELMTIGKWSTATTDGVPLGCSVEYFTDLEVLSVQRFREIADALVEEVRIFNAAFRGA